MILTSGEKMIWASVFAQSLQEQVEDMRKEGGPKDNDDFDLCTRCAVESAWEAIESLQRLRKDESRKDQPYGRERAMFLAMLRDDL